VRNLRSEVSALGAALGAGEQVIAWIPAALSAGRTGSGPSYAGVLAVTTERLVFHAAATDRRQCVPLTGIVAVDLQRRRGGELSLVTLGGPLRFVVDASAAARWLAAAEEQMQRVSHGTPQVVAAPAHLSGRKVA